VNRVRVDGWPPRDSAGAIEPHKLNAISMFRAFPWLVKAFQTKVPEDYWSEAVDPDTEAPIADVKCPCGENPQVGGPTAVECDCGRFFLFLGDELRCFKPEGEADS
jgi:hypothetical protein